MFSIPTEEEQKQKNIEALKVYLEDVSTDELEYSKYELHDNTYSPKGWQYKRYGNSTVGKALLTKCRAEMTKVQDDGKCARNDSDPRYYASEVFKDNDTVIRISTSPSRSGNSCTYTVTQLKRVSNV